MQKNLTYRCADASPYYGGRQNLPLRIWAVVRSESRLRSAKCELQTIATQHRGLLDGQDRLAGVLTLYRDATERDDDHHIVEGMA